MLHVGFAREGEQLATAHAEVRSCTTNVAAEQATMVVRLRLHGLLPKAAAALAYELDEVLSVSMDARQLQLFDGSPPEPEPEPDGPVDTGLRGRLVVLESGDDRVAGIVTDEAKEAITIDTLEGGAREVGRPSSGIMDTVLDVVAPEGADLEGLLATYCTQAMEAQMVPSWHDIVTAIGELYSEGSLKARSDFVWELEPQVLTRALEVAKESAPSESAP